ncbi:MAG: TonB-dependent receptor, partial [Alistipes sp.]|nr:TonB-dependent receptor [Alistipes sp.]
SSLSGSEDMETGLRQWGLREEVLWSPSASHDVRFGVQSSLHRVVTGEIVSVGGDGFRSRESEVRRGWENAVWIGDEWRPCERLGINFGVRLELFTVLGGSPFYRLDESGGIAATEPYRGRREAVKTYAGVEPRVSVNFMLTERSSLKAAYGRTSQNIHSVSSSAISSPFDRYVPSSNLIRPEVADHLSAGYVRTFGRGAWELSVEGYWKSVDGQLDYRDATTYSDAVQIETLLLAGRGRAYGAEVLLRRSRGRVTGWIAYTLSRSENRIPGIDSGRWYTAGNDRTHDVSIVAMWNISPRWELSASWVFASGQAMTLPNAKYWMENVGWLYYYDRRNASRAPASHRLDISAVYRLRSRGRWSHEIVFGLYNAYNRYNPYMITFEETAGGRTEAIQYSLFGAVPFVSYNFKLR